MRKILSFFVIMLMSFSAMAEHHGGEKGAENADLHAAIKAFNDAYENNTVEKYFSLYAKTRQYISVATPGRTSLLTTNCGPR